ncbi:ABC transporter permease [Salarchaeum sp. JOR-1]|uniref:ABC transporter permease n=1 Tax=Salarchaeum sp. JOR-1 TaxID=2599399 RepID=UPI001198897A|nr:ABC transporter permease [Salarchaeum sp. JOR-1]QDX39651.1 ABC transporter permease [Salarchaeum sp. JOR-1]
MSSIDRVRAEFRASLKSFLRRRTAVFFTFFFPVLLIVIFAGLVRTGGGGTGLFSQPPGYYVPAYLATVVLFTPLSRVGSTVARHREGARFEKLSTTPLAAWEWLAAHTLVNAALIAAACAVLVGALAATGADFALSPWLAVFVPTASVLFCGIGAVLGSLADSQDGAISMSNGVALPLLFLSDTFVSPAALPEWFVPLLNLSPLTYFARGVRAATYTGGDPTPEFAVTLALAALAFLAGVYALPWRE